ALYVRQGMRRSGAGRAMMHQLALRAAGDGAERVVTMPLTGARSEQRFLSGLGFLPVGSRRIADTASLLRRLETHPQGKARRPRRIEELIARRRRSRGLPETPPGGVDLRRLAEEISQRDSTNMHVSRQVQTRLPDVSSSTISCAAVRRPSCGAVAVPVTQPWSALRRCVACMSTLTAARRGPACAVSAIEASVSARAAEAPPCNNPAGWVLPATG